MIATAILFCAAGSVTFAESARLTYEQEAKVQEKITRLLKDPESARFSPLVAATQDNGDTQVCGTVDSKNEFGGYVGEMPFIGKFVGSGFYLTKIAATEAEASNIYGLCESYGLSVEESDL
jgi:hypothetical protein